MRKYEIPVKFTFSGVFKIMAESRAQALDYADRHCGMTATRGIHSTLSQVDWDFPVHPKKTIKKG